MKSLVQSIWQCIGYCIAHAVTLNRCRELSAIQHERVVFLLALDEVKGEKSSLDSGGKGLITNAIKLAIKLKTFYLKLYYLKIIAQH